jgi:hypothetical protein
MCDCARFCDLNPHTAELGEDMSGGAARELSMVLNTLTHIYIRKLKADKEDDMANRTHLPLVSAPFRPSLFSLSLHCFSLRVFCVLWYWCCVVAHHPCIVHLVVTFVLCMSLPAGGVGV